MEGAGIHLVAGNGCHACIAMDGDVAAPPVLAAADASAVSVALGAHHGIALDIDVEFEAVIIF